MFYNKLNNKCYYYVNAYNKNNYCFKNNKTLNVTFTNIIIKVITYKVFDFSINIYNAIAYFIILKIYFLNIKNIDYIF